MKNFPITDKVTGKEYWISRSMAAAIVVVTDDGKFIAERRGPGCPDNVGKLVFPCGYLDFDESLEECAKREVYEELGLKVTELHFLGLNDDPSANRQNITARYAAKVEGKPDTNSLARGGEKDEVAEVLIMDINEILEKPEEWAFGHAKLAEYVNEHMTEIFDEPENHSFLRRLLATPSLSGYERDASCEFLKYVGEEKGQMDFFNNAWVEKGEGHLKVLIEAHIDQIGLQVQLVTDDGYLHVDRVGGIDKKVLPGTKVWVLTEDKKIPGVIGKKPIHCEESAERGKVADLETLLVDVGASSKKEVEDLGIGCGTLVSFELKPDLAFGPKKDKILSPGLDDKIGVYIVSQVFKEVNNPEITLVAGATAQEETGLRGSGVLAKRVEPDLSISLDVTFCAVEGVKKEDVGDVVLGKGPVIMHGSDKSPRVAKALKKVAKTHGIPYQEAVSGPRGTNTTNIQESSRNCETYLISIPNKNMHTQVEICDWNDVENTIKLLTEFLKTL